MTACKDESKTVVGNARQIRVTRQRRFLRLNKIRHHPPLRCLTSQRVDCSSPSDGRQPRSGLNRNPTLGPSRQGPCERVLHALLGHVDVAGDANGRREHEGPLATVGRSDRGLDIDGTRNAIQPTSLIGRTSTPPKCAGIWLAMAIAASRSPASMT